MKRGITAPLSFTALYLFGVIYIERIRETVVCLAEGDLVVPASWLVERFPTRKRRFPRALGLMNSTEGIPR